MYVQHHASATFRHDKPVQPNVRLSPRRLTQGIDRLLAEFHTGVNIASLPLFHGNVDRLLVFALLLRTSLSRPDRDGAISIHSAALSLGRPFETVRRHVTALTEMGICHRIDAGVTIRPTFWTRPEAERALRRAHDCFVRFVADSTVAGLVQAPPIRAISHFTLEHGLCAASDLLLALVDRNRPLLPEAVDLAIVSAVHHGNAQRLEADARMFGGSAQGMSTFMPNHALRIAAVARTLALPDTTVRRRVGPLIGAGLPFTRVRTGLIVSAQWLANREDLVARDPRHGTLQMILNRAAAAGFPFPAPASAYCDGRPESPHID